jgi:hypothetical protein
VVGSQPRSGWHPGYSDSMLWDKQSYRERNKSPQSTSIAPPIHCDSLVALNHDDEWVANVDNNNPEPELDKKIPFRSF